MTFEKFLDNYRKSLVTKGKSSNTIKLYLRDITLYLENSKNSGISQQHLKIIPLFKKEKILDYFLYLKDRYRHKNDGVAINKLYLSLIHISEPTRPY